MLLSHELAHSSGRPDRTDWPFACWWSVVYFTITEHLATDLEESTARLATRERHWDHHALPGLRGILFFALIFGMPLPGQTNSVSTSQANQLPFSGRANANGQSVRSGLPDESASSWLRSILEIPAYKLVRPIAAMAKDISPTTVRAR